jgi:5-hydroxyisourate hydrolase-like protein (transthyretin family)
MLPGPGHTALAVQQAVFPAEGPLVVTVSSGATLRGQLGPEAAWAELKRLAGHEGAARPGQLPSIMLHRGEGRAREQFPDFRSHQTVKPDGSFELTGIPPGQWNVLISYFTSQGGQGGHGSFGKQEPAGTVDLVDDQVTTIAPDLSRLLPGTLEALVMHDGAPLANTLVNLGRLVPGAQWPQPEDALTTDGEGRLRASLRAGEYRASWFAQHGNGSSSMLPSLETAIVRVGETTQQRFTIVSGTVKVRLVDSSGAPVANVQIMLANVAGESTEGLGATGADGRIEKRFTPGTFTASVMPKRLQDQKALMEFYRTATDPAAMLRAFVTVGTITVRAGETHEVELRLPADW